MWQVSDKDAPERLGSRVVVFCHFDGRGRIRPHTRAYIDVLRDEGLDLVFVSNAARFGEEDLAWLRRRAARIIVRHNVGYDFAAWRDALPISGLPAAETRLLLIANDSVYGPLRPIGPVLRQIDFDVADLWSATDSWQHSFHLQSFFMAFGPKAMHDPAFGSF
jgi:lipopolysaccharide biosynthesis protein